MYELKIALRKMFSDEEELSYKIARSLIIFIVLFSVLSCIVESTSLISDSMRDVLYICEVVFTVFFIIEYLGRVMSKDYSLGYILSPLGIFDLIAIAPFFFMMVFSKMESEIAFRVYVSLRVVRFLKLFRYVPELDIMKEALAVVYKRILAFFAIVMFTVVVSSAIIFIVDGGKDFTSIAQTMYWSILNVTTLGSTSVLPASFAGRFIHSILALMGLGIIAVPTGFIMAEMTQVISRKKSKMKCKLCGLKTHDADALYCKKCGWKLD